MPTSDTRSVKGLVAAVLALPNDSQKKTLIVALATCLCCSVIVATAAVALKPTQRMNQENDRKENILAVSGLDTRSQSMAQAFEKIQSQLIELSSGKVSDAYNPETFDIEKAGKDPALSTALPRNADPAGLKRQPKYMPVYMVYDEQQQLKTLILPVYGAGLWSRLYGFLALEGDLRTVQGLKFYQHTETPGLGGEVDNRKWRAQWRGKLVYDENWQPDITLIKGSVTTATPNAAHKVDGLAGATLTSRGVTNLINYWLGKNGYGPLIERLRSQKGEHS